MQKLHVRCVIEESLWLVLAYTKQLYELRIILQNSDTACMCKDTSQHSIEHWIIVKGQPKCHHLFHV